jgi:CheY-like chemotaxis protein
MITNQPAKKRVLLVEDEGEIRTHLVRILRKYAEFIDIAEAADIGQALQYLRTEPSHDAVILDLMMTYGDAKGELQGQTDEGNREGGIRLLELLREREKESGVEPVMVFVITARTDFAAQSRVHALLGERGRFYTKPFYPSEFEDELAKALGLTSRVSAARLQDEDEAL